MIWFAPPPPVPASAQTTSVPVAGRTQVATPTVAATGEAYFLFIQGRTLEGRGDVPGAIAAYRKAIALMPQSADVRAELAGLFAREGRAAESITEAESALKADPANREAHRILGFVRSALADNQAGRAASPLEATLVTQAIDHFEKALAGGMRDPGVELSLGRLYVRTAQHPKAIATLQAFLNDQPGYPEGVLLLVESLDATRQFTQAVNQLEPLVRDEPDMVPARARLAEMYERVGRHADAIPHWAELARANPSNAALRTRYATALANGGQIDEARKQLTALTSEVPRDVDAWYLLSQVESRAGRHDAADAAAKKISDIDPADPRGPLAQAEARAARGDHRGAVAMLEPVLAALRDQPPGDAYSEVATAFAAALQNSDDTGRAVRVLEDARNRAPRDFDLLHALAAAYSRDKNPAAAERTYRELLAADPIDGLALDGLGWAQVQQGRVEDGRVVLERAAAALPTRSVTLDHLAESLFLLKRYRDAQAMWDRALTGDRTGIDVEDVTRKRDRARALAGGL